MSSSSVPLSADPLLTTLADFRFELRRFLHFSEAAATAVGLHPQQHQLLLQIAGAPDSTPTTVAYAAERLGLRHHSVVELADRSEHEGLLRRAEDPTDRRRVLLRLAPKGKRLLNRLAGDHLRELDDQAPRLAAALDRIRGHRRPTRKPAGAR